ncbi:MAG: 4-(cytidine 5'-diphospho)-2-C-methyl-D-erythritol kinase, partial [Candidatus Omnitrophica bacterium]|nr:4-(cytidine 5'-diphospho)-2-C-methyl-D-erythritol kinase [Candidatus Omnitrophota bacterium]
MILQSHAKLNLFLEVRSKRRDNFHNLRTIFERIDLSDKIILTLRKKDRKIKVICANPQVPRNSTNLCFRSAKLLQDRFNIGKGVNIRIIKKIPVGAGLGGGSSNAAAVFLGLNKLWELNLKLSRLVSLSKKIGCDVPFFIYNTNFALATQRGDKITPLRHLKGLRLWHVVVVPKINVSTAKIYDKFDAYSGLTPHFRRSKDSNLDESAGLTRPKYDVKLFNLALRNKDLSLLGGLIFNSLEKVTLRLYPEVGRIKQQLFDLGVESILMSGSGPAVFGIVASRKEALSVLRRLKGVLRSKRVFVAR